MDLSDNARLTNNIGALSQLFSLTMGAGDTIRPRGSVIKELRDQQIVMNPQFPFQGFKSRKYDIEYFKHEMRWKLGASKYDDSIKQHAKMWESVQNPDGTFNSNYGQFWFGQQQGLMKAVFELMRDMDSRRASIPMLTDAHLSPETNDTVCTEAVTLHIRNYQLFMSVHMRSSDQIFGLGTDIPTFSVLFNLAHGLLSDYYEGLGIGSITITAASSHIYERHFKMVESILAENLSEYKAVELPKCSGPAEAMSIIASRGKKGQLPRHNWALYRFLYE